MSSSFQQAPPDEATIADYLSNRLTQTRAEAFEAYCLRNPDFARRVELDLVFKAGLKQTLGRARALRPRLLRSMVLATAACLAVVLACGLLLFPRTHSGAPLAYGAMTEVPSPLLSGARVSIALIRLREGATAHRIIAPRQAGVLTVRVVPDSPPGRLGYTMEVALEPGAISRSVTLDDLHPDADGYIDAYLPLAALIGQTLKITVNPSPAAGTQTPPFRIEVAYAQNTLAVTP